MSRLRAALELLGGYDIDSPLESDAFFALYLRERVSGMVCLVRLVSR